MFGLDLSALQEKTKNIQEHCFNMEVFHKHQSGVFVIVTANKIKDLEFEAEKHSPEQVKEAINECFEKLKHKTKEYFETNIESILETVPRIFRQELKKQLLSSC